MKLRRFVQVLGPWVFVAFLSLTVWRIVVQGLLEKSSIDAPHLAAGAGDSGLIAQLCLGLFGIVVCALWMFADPRRSRRWMAVLFLVLFPVLFVFTARGLQRFPSGYSDGAFEALTDLHQSGQRMTVDEVKARLGDPLLSKSESGGGQIWLYSYMPSCGLGWDKSYLSIDSHGRMTEIWTISEP